MFNEKCEVLQNIQLASNIFEMKLRTEKIAHEALPGQFIHIKVNSSLYPLLRRPISINKADKAEGTVTIVYHKIGQGTEEISHLQAGDMLDVIGPLGKGFPMFKGKKCAVVGGGMGIAPLLELARNLEHCDAYLGFKDELYMLKHFNESCDNVFIATESGILGDKGYITDLFEKHVNGYDLVYTCGPKAMLIKVMELCDKYNIECYISVEERMGCGVGACLVCTCSVKGSDGEWHNRRVCKDGPVFRAEEVEFDA